MMDAQPSVSNPVPSPCTPYPLPTGVPSGTPGCGTDCHQRTGERVVWQHPRGTACHRSVRLRHSAEVCVCVCVKGQVEIWGVAGLIVLFPTSNGPPASMTYKNGLFVATTACLTPFPPVLFHSIRSFTAQNAQQYLSAYLIAYTSTNNAYDITLQNAPFYRLVSPISEISNAMCPQYAYYCTYVPRSGSSAYLTPHYATLAMLNAIDKPKRACLLCT